MHAFFSVNLFIIELGIGGNNLTISVYYIGLFCCLCSKNYSTHQSYYPAHFYCEVARRLPERPSALHRACSNRLETTV